MNVCTIVAKNYLAHARVLARSLTEQHPDSRLTVLVLDDAEGYVDPAEEPYRLWTPDDIDCDAFEDMAEQYSVIELSTAVKPWLLRRLLREQDHAIYLDPDIQVTAPLDELRDLARRHGIVLTPHNLSPIPRDGMYPSEESILIAGAYNLGFIALGAGATAEALLEWWSERLETDCVVDPASGRFVDQKWIDLVPGIWPTTHLLRDPAYNIAYWNLHARRLEQGEQGPTIEGRPVRFLHFSGYDPREPGRLSKHQNRIRFSERPDVRRVADGYRRLLLADGFEQASRWPYGLANRYSNGSDAPIQVALGANVVGYLTAELGVGEVARQAIGALDAAGVPVTPVRVSSGVSREDHLFDRLENDAQGEYAVNLMCVNADMLPTVAGDLGPDFFSGRRTVGWWWWEVDSFSDRYRGAFELVDEVWAGSAFVAETLRDAGSPVPIVRIPTPVTMGADVVPDRAAAGFGEEFVFLFVFDFNSVLDRKNPDGLVDAFVRAFPDAGAGARLVLKSINGERHPEAFARLRAVIADHPHVELRDGYLEAAAKDALIASCDCYVSLHRSEGFGITLAEAMLLGRPVIGTGYSGVTDYLSEDTGFPVRSTPVAVGEGNDPYPADAHWAEPDVEHAAALMRRVRDDPAEAAARAARGQAFIREHHSPETTGRAMADRIKQVAIAPNDASSRRGPEVTAQQARTDTLDLIGSPPPTPASRPGALADQVKGRLLRREHSRRREIDEALWWSIESSAVVTADLQRRVERLEYENRTLKRRVAGARNAQRQLEGRAGALEQRMPELDLLSTAAAAEPFVSGEPFTRFDAPDAGRVLGYHGAAPAAGQAGDYLAFEEVFRGSETLIRDRQERYASLLEGRGPVLDVGCGRGELLEVLRDAGIEARGVDLDPALVARCRAKGLTVEQGDGVAAVSALGDRELGAICSLQVVEHLDEADLRTLLTEAHRVLRDGGRLIMETVNPHSPAALKSFWVDLTHEHPVFPEVLLQLCRQAGFHSALAFVPTGSGDWDADRLRHGEYAVVAER